MQRGFTSWIGNFVKDQVEGIRIGSHLGPSIILATHNPHPHKAYSGIQV